IPACIRVFVRFRDDLSQKRSGSGVISDLRHPIRAIFGHLQLALPHHSLSAAATRGETDGFFAPYGCSAGGVSQLGLVHAIEKPGSGRMIGVIRAIRWIDGRVNLRLVVSSPSFRDVGFHWRLV